MKDRMLVFGRLGNGIIYNNNICWCFEDQEMVLSIITIFLLLVLTHNKNICIFLLLIVGL